MTMMNPCLTSPNWQTMINQKGNNMKATIVAILLGMSVTAFGADKPADKPVVNETKPAKPADKAPAAAPAAPVKKGEGLKK